ncbi:MAG: hypothetical protein ACPLKQ_05755 [Candidatus Bathyarchaeales archaeon]
MRSSGWSHDKVLPKIRQIIYDLCSKKKDWVTKDEIVKALESDPDISSIAAEAASSGKFNGNTTKIFSNMVDFMNLWLTEFESGRVPDPWSGFAKETLEMFERRKVNGKWAFKLRK